jgi:hypothetical protein
VSASQKALQELHDLLDLIAEGNFSEGVRTQLNSILRGNFDLQTVYLEYLGLHAALAWDTVDRSTNMDRILAPGSTVSLPLLEKTAPRSRRLSPRVIALAASLLLVGYFAALGGLLVWDRTHPRDLHQDVAAQISTDQFAKLISAKDCEWDSNARPSAVGTWLPTNEMHLRQGIAELQFADGAQVIIEGPADFAIHSSSQGFLRRGRLLATVPHEAVGFTIETPTIRVVDLGTEFGVGVDATGRTDVEVITGQVDVRYESSKSGGAQKKVRVTAGTARRFSSRVGGEGVANTSIAPWVEKAAIGKSLAGAGKKLPSEIKYAAAVLADHPLGYWRFSDGGDREAVDASGNGLNGQYYGFVSTSNPGLCVSTRDRSVRFLGSSNPGWIEINDVELPPSLTIELWARSATPEWNAFCWPLSSHFIANGILIHSEQGSRELNFLVIDDRGSHYKAAGFAPGNIADRLHHYVFAFDAERNQGWMYFDGQLVNEHTNVLQNGGRTKSAKLPMHVGRQYGRPERCGEGWIDELAIYPKVLSADAVQRHFVAAEIPATDPEPKRETSVD